MAQLKQPFEIPIDQSVDVTAEGGTDHDWMDYLFNGLVGMGAGMMPTGMLPMLMKMWQDKRSKGGPVKPKLDKPEML